MASATGHLLQLAILTADAHRIASSCAPVLFTHCFLRRTLAALTHPALFSSLVLIDPVIVKPKPDTSVESVAAAQLVLGALMRRESWPSRYDPYF